MIFQKDTRKEYIIFGSFECKAENNPKSMNVVKEQSAIIATHLKELRNAKGISHETLSEQLEKKYGIKISADSLQNYEVGETYHKKAFKNLGMRLEYLWCLSDFYGVSSDFLLGRTKNPGRVPSAIDDLGLNEETVLWLNAVKHAPNHDLFRGIHKLLGNLYFQGLMYSLVDFESAVKADKIYDYVEKQFIPEDQKQDSASFHAVSDSFYKRIHQIAKDGQFSDSVSEYLLARNQMEHSDTPVNGLFNVILDLYGRGAHDICSYRVNRTLNDLLIEIESSIDCDVESIYNGLKGECVRKE